MQYYDKPAMSDWCEGFAVWLQFPRRHEANVAVWLLLASSILVTPFITQLAQPDVILDKGFSELARRADSDDDRENGDSIERSLSLRPLLNPWSAAPSWDTRRQWTLRDSNHSNCWLVADQGDT